MKIFGYITIWLLTYTLYASAFSFHYDLQCKDGDLVASVNGLGLTCATLKEMTATRGLGIRIEADRYKLLRPAVDKLVVAARAFLQ